MLCVMYIDLHAIICLFINIFEKCINYFISILHIESLIIFYCVPLVPPYLHSYSDGDLTLIYPDGGRCSSGFQRMTIINFDCNKDEGEGAIKYSNNDPKPHPNTNFMTHQFNIQGNNTNLTWSKKIKKRRNTSYELYIFLVLLHDLPDR